MSTLMIKGQRKADGRLMQRIGMSAGALLLFGTVAFTIAGLGDRSDNPPQLSVGQPAPPRANSTPTLRDAGHEDRESWGPFRLTDW